MERALDLNLLSQALGGREPLPTPEELATTIGAAELSLLAGRGEIEEGLLQVAWYLHGVASVRVAPELYGLDRQQAAYRVAAHILDLSLRSTEHDEGRSSDGVDRLRRCFAAQVSYMRSGLDPNALALYRRERVGLQLNSDLLRDGDRPALLAGAALLGGDIRGLFVYSERLRDAARAVATRWDLESLALSPLGPPLEVALAARHVAVHLVYGREGELERARRRLFGIIERHTSTPHRDARWVAALLLDMLDGLDSSSVRGVLPPDIPEGVKRAFTIADPPIITLWPPQIDLLGTARGVGALDPNIRRLLISAPTSAGKTLIAQLLIASHLAREQSGVCYVAPTRSLCREVQGAIQQRLSYIAYDVTANMPEWRLPEYLTPDRSDVEVMTPERLAYLLRAEGRGLLDRFGMFVFDEVHNISDRARGWTLESDLTFIHEATAQTPHRLILVSAAVSNRAHFVSWLTSDDTEPVAFHQDWRGPRRLNTLWRTQPDWERGYEMPRPRPNSPRRQGYPLKGHLIARDPGSGRFVRLTMEEDVGELVLRQGERTRRDALSTPNYKTAVPLVHQLAGLGPVLVVESTRDRARLMARALADAAPETWTGDQILNDAALEILGEDHELTRVLRRGVGYHHGSLPAEIRAQLEDAVSVGALQILVSTTTLTEGINLPVRSVVISARGAYGSEEYAEYITGAKLLNAIGRAGRAAKETEGIVAIVVDGQNNLREDFTLFDPDEADLVVRSPLATEDALARLAELEDAARRSIDAIYEASGAPADFISFVWFVASELERQNEAITDEAVQQVLRRSLGWLQLDDEGQATWIRLARTTTEAYRTAPPQRRRRWATAGMSVGSARTLEAIALEVAEAIPPNAEALAPDAALRIVLANGRLGRLLALPEAPQPRLRKSLAGPKDEDGHELLQEILSDWVGGRPLREMSDTHLAQIANPGSRLEELVDLISSHFELFLPWALNTVVAQSNEIARAETDTPLGAPNQYSESLAACVRWGVNNQTSLELTLRGVISRRLAMVIAEQWRDFADVYDGNVFTWLGNMRVTDWAEAFETSPAELRNLLEVVRPRGGDSAARFLRGEPIRLKFQLTGPLLAPAPAELRLETVDEMEVVSVWAEGRRLGYLSTRHQGDVVGFIRGGLLLEANIEADGQEGQLTLRLVEP